MKETLRIIIGRIRGFLSRQFQKYDEKLPYIITIFFALILVVGGINLFVELTDALKTEALAYYDQRITDYVISLRSPGLTQYFKIVTEIGDAYGYLVVLVIVTVLSALVFKRWKYIGQIVLVLALSAISNMMLKRAIDRARPGIEHLVSVETLSYPSGHAMSAMAFYGFLIYLIYNFDMGRWVKVGSILFFIVLILSIGISPIYFGVPFPSDIARGFIASFILVFFCKILFETIAVFRHDVKT